MNSCKNYLNDSTTNKSERVIEEIKFTLNLQWKTEVWVNQLNQRINNKPYQRQTERLFWHSDIKQKIIIIKKYQATTLTTLVVITIFSSVFISCNKEHSSIPQTVTTKKKTRQSYIEVYIIRGINIWVDNIYLECVAGGPICKFYMRIGNQEIGTGGYKGLLRKTSDGHLEAELLKDNMDNEVLSYFNEGIMEMPQERVVDQSLIDAIGFEDDYIISEGQYEYTETSNAFIVKF